VVTDLDVLLPVAGGRCVSGTPLAARRSGRSAPRPVGGVRTGRSAGTDGALTAAMPALAFAIGGAIALIAIFIVLALLIRSDRAPR
jgi:hypothetical protein